MSWTDLWFWAPALVFLALPLYGVARLSLPKPSRKTETRGMLHNTNGWGSIVDGVTEVVIVDRRDGYTKVGGASVPKVQRVYQWVPDKFIKTVWEAEI